MKELITLTEKEVDVTLDETINTELNTERAKTTELIKKAGLAKLELAESRLPRTQFLSTYRRTQSAFPSVFQVNADMLPEFAKKENTSPSVLVSVSDWAEHDKLPKTEGAIDTDTFQFQGCTWCLKVCPQGNGRSKGTHVSVFLKQLPGDQEPISTSFGLGILKMQGTACNGDASLRFPLQVPRQRNRGML